jgi:hypothetical protein
MRSMACAIHNRLCSVLLHAVSTSGYVVINQGVDASLEGGNVVIQARGLKDTLHYCLIVKELQYAVILITGPALTDKSINT